MTGNIPSSRAYEFCVCHCLRSISLRQESRCRSPHLIVFYMYEKSNMINDDKSTNEFRSESRIATLDIGAKKSTGCISKCHLYVSVDFLIDSIHNSANQPNRPLGQGQFRYSSAPISWLEKEDPWFVPDGSRSR